MSGPRALLWLVRLHSLGDLSKTKIHVRVFNLSMTIVIGAVGGFTYLACGGLPHLDGDLRVGQLLRSVAMPLLAADVAICIANALILAGIVRLNQKVPIRRFAGSMLSSSGPAYVGYGVIGLLFVILWLPAGVGPFSAVLVLAPLFVARWAFVQYGDEQRAHRRTLSALVTAVEAKDPFTRATVNGLLRLCDSWQQRRIWARNEQRRFVSRVCWMTSASSRCQRESSAPPRRWRGRS